MQQWGVAFCFWIIIFVADSTIYGTYSKLGDLCWLCVVVASLVEVATNVARVAFIFYHLP